MTVCETDAEDVAQLERTPDCEFVIDGVRERVGPSVALFDTLCVSVPVTVLQADTLDENDVDGETESEDEGELVVAGEGVAPGDGEIDALPERVGV